MGHRGVVPAGGVQYMSAGTGVVHSEFNHSRERDVHFVQMWVLPRSAGEPPAYGQHLFERAERTNRWLAIATGEAGVDAPIALRQDATVRVARLEADASLDVALDAGRLGFLFVASGSVSVNGARLDAGDAIRASGAQRFTLAAGPGAAELVAWDVPPTAAA
jgi:redox-sensitive bicupin YhaK (pirin superfamily)